MAALPPYVRSPGLTLRRPHDVQVTIDQTDRISAASRALLDATPVEAAPWVRYWLAAFHS